MWVMVKILSVPNCLWPSLLIINAQLADLVAIGLRGAD